MNQDLIIEALLKQIEAQSRQIEAQNRQIEILQREKEEIKAENLTLKVKVDEFAARTPTQPKSSVPKVPEPPKPTEPPKPPEPPKPYKPFIPPETPNVKEPPRPLRQPDYKGKLIEMVTALGEFIGENFKVNAITQAQNIDDIVNYAAVETNWLDRLIDSYEAYLTFEPGTNVPPQVTYIVQDIFDTFYDDIYDRFLSNS